MSEPHSQERPPTRDPEPIAVLDEEFLAHYRESAGDDFPIFLASLIDVFDHEFRERRTELIAVLAQRQVEQKLRVIHRLAGSIGNLGLRRAESYCRLVERQLRAGDAVDGAKIVEQIDALVAEGREALDHYR